MADDKRGRDKKAHDEDRRQRERELAEARERADEGEPPRDEPGEEFGDLDDALEAHEYPTTTDAVVESYGDHEVETRDGRTSVEDVLAPVDDETYDSADDVRTRIRTLVDRD